ncbi:MAG: glycosyltransferase family 4 protein, partial [Anaerolineae bacterium]
ARRQRRDPAPRAVRAPGASGGARTMSRARLHVLLAVHSPYWGGASDYLLTLAQHLSGADYRFTALFPCDGEAVEGFRIAGIETAALPGGQSGYRAQDIPAVWRAIRHYQPDVVYGNTFCGGTRNVGIAARLVGRPFIWHIHEVLHENAPLRHRAFLRLAQVIAVPSEASAASIKSILPAGVPVRLILNPVDVETISAAASTRAQARTALRESLNVAADRPILLSIGRIDPVKGHDYLLRIAAAVVRACPDTLFLVVGSIAPVYQDYFDQLLQMRRELGLEQHVRFEAFRRDIVPVLYGADMLVHTSRTESFGRVLVEAMAAGLPVVAFDAGAVGEIIKDGETGYLVRDFDIDHYAARVIDLLKDASLREQIGSRGYGDVLERYAIARTMPMIDALLQMVATPA